MPNAITEEQKSKLMQAIDKASGLGACEYVRKVYSDDVNTTQLEPRCVIGQLAALEGLSLSDLSNWHGIVGRLKLNGYPKADILDSYPNILLSKLQNLWDRADSRTLADTVKLDMRGVVENWNSNQSEV